MIKPRLEMTTLAELALLALPLGLIMMLVSLDAQIPRYFIERHLGERELGIFGAMAYLMVAGDTVVNAIGQSASPRLATYYAEGDRPAFRKLLMKLIGAGVLMGGIGVLLASIAGPQILTFIYKPEYAEYSDVFVWLMVAAGVSYVAAFLGYGITATRQFNRFPMPYLTVTVITFACSMFLIPSLGLLGAAWALCAASVASCVMPLIILNLNPV